MTEYADQIEIEVAEILRDAPRPLRRARRRLGKAIADHAVEAAAAWLVDHQADQIDQPDRDIELIADSLADRCAGRFAGEEGLVRNASAVVSIVLAALIGYVIRRLLERLFGDGLACDEPLTLEL